MALYYYFLLARYPVCSQLVFCMHFCVEGVFLMYLWRQMYSMSTYPSAILFSAWMLTQFSNFELEAIKFLKRLQNTYLSRAGFVVNESLQTKSESVN